MRGRVRWQTIRTLPSVVGPETRHPKPAVVHAFGMRHFADQERRDRIARRHALAPDHRVGDAESAVQAMTVLHATEPPTVYLSVACRVDGVSVADVDAALFEDRTLVRQLAMRRTLFVFPRDLLPAAWGSAAARVADQEYRRIAKEAAASGLAEDGEKWLDDARRAVLDVLHSEDRGLTTTEIRARVPEVSGTVSVAPGTKWGGDVPIAPRVLTQLGASGAIVRAENDSHWRISRHRWKPMDRWLDDVPAPLSAEEGYAELVRRWLTTFGPGTTTDIKWWLGSTVGAVKQALRRLEAVEVSLERGATGWVLPDDLDETGPVESWAALLPVLDPTLMGWKERDFYVDPEHVPYLFDSNGNGGTTAWWNGRVVGCWVQDDAGVVHPVLREDVGEEGAAALATEAERLSAWLDGTRISSVYASLQMKSAKLP